MEQAISVVKLPLLVWFVGLFFLIGLLRVTTRDFGFHFVLRIFFASLLLLVVSACHRKGYRFSGLWLTLLIFCFVCSSSYWSLYIYSERAAFSRIEDLLVALISYLWPLAFSLFSSLVVTVIYTLASRTARYFSEKGKP